MKGNRTTISISGPLTKAFQQIRGVLLLHANIDLTMSEIINVVLADSIAESANSIFGPGTVPDWRMLIDEDDIPRFEEIREKFKTPEVVAMFTNPDFIMTFARSIEKEM